MPLPQASHNVSINPLQLSSIVASAMLALQTNEMVADVTHLATILTVDVASCGRVCRGHGLHPHGRIQQRKVLPHVFRALFAQRAGVVVSTHVHGEAAEVHDVAAPEAAKRFCALKHGLVTDGAIALKPLGDAVVVICEGDARVATHAVAVIDAQALS